MREFARSDQVNIVLSHTSNDLDTFFTAEARIRLGFLGNVILPRVDSIELVDSLGRLTGPSILIAEWSTGLDEKTMRLVPALVACIRSGEETLNIDLDAATKLGVIVANTPGNYVTAVTEFTIGLVIDLARAITWEHMRMSSHPSRSVRMGTHVKGKVLGLIGLGAIGSEVARVAISLGMRVYGYDPDVKEVEPPIESVGLEKLLSESDFVSVHTRLNPATRGLLSFDEFALMKSGAFVINTSRGGVVDEIALADALVAGSIGGAALDVFEEEAPIRSPVLVAPNVVHTGHIAGFTREAFCAQAEATVDAVEHVLNGRMDQVAVLNQEVLGSPALRARSIWGG